MRLAVTGGRDYRLTDDDRALLIQFFIDNPNTTLIHGAAKGADTDCARLADSKCIAVEPHPAKWRRADGSTDYDAGTKRNIEMLSRESSIDILLAFPGYKGTPHAVRTARANGILVVIAHPERNHV